jgi:glycosyltransferase involved in cell wall biosynthesis
MSLKLLYVINSLGAGGAERSLAEMLPYFQQADVSPLIACFGHTKQGVEAQVLQQGFNVRFLGDNGSLPARMRALHQLIRAEQPHIVQTTLFDADVIGRLANIGKGSRVLTSLVNTSYDPIRLQDPRVNAKKLRVARLIDAWTARLLTEHFHAITHAVKESAVQTLGISPKRVTVIERGRDPKRLGSNSLERRQEARRLLGVEDGDEVLLNVGRQEFQKGQIYLLEAMQQLAAKRPRAQLFIAGREGHASEELRKAWRQLGLEEKVHFLDHREDIPELLAAADLFVFPSLYEGLGASLIEAMALGLPIVTTKIAPIQEVVEEGKNALLVEPGNAAQLATAVDSLLCSKERVRAFAQRSRQIFEDRFTLERSAQRMVELYYKVAEKR